MFKVRNSLKLASILTLFSLVISGGEPNIGLGIFQLVLYIIIIYLIVAE